MEDQDKRLRQPLSEVSHWIKLGRTPEDAAAIPVFYVLQLVLATVCQRCLSTSEDLMQVKCFADSLGTGEKKLSQIEGKRHRSGPGAAPEWGGKPLTSADPRRHLGKLQ